MEVSHAPEWRTVVPSCFGLCPHLLQESGECGDVGAQGKERSLPAWRGCGSAGWRTGVAGEGPHPTSEGPHAQPPLKPHLISYPCLSLEYAPKEACHTFHALLSAQKAFLSPLALPTQGLVWVPRSPSSMLLTPSSFPGAGEDSVVGDAGYTQSSEGPWGSLRLACSAPGLRVPTAKTARRLPLFPNKGSADSVFSFFLSFFPFSFTL